VKLRLNQTLPAAQPTGESAAWPGESAAWADASARAGNSPTRELFGADLVLA
jgi:hypothetical protein